MRSGVRERRRPGERVAHRRLGPGPLVGHHQAENREHRLVAPALAVGGRADVAESPLRLLGGYRALAGP
eukprot:7987276-Pyramimonas_sp.AAC.1